MKKKLKISKKFNKSQDWEILEDGGDVEGKLNAEMQKDFNFQIQGQDLMNPFVRPVETYENEMQGQPERLLEGVKNYAYLDKLNPNRSYNDVLTERYLFPYRPYENPQEKSSIFRKPGTYDPYTHVADLYEGYKEYSNSVPKEEKKDLEKRTHNIAYGKGYKNGGRIPKAGDGKNMGYSWSTQQAPSYQPTFQGNYASSKTTGNRALTSKEMQANKIAAEKRVQEQKEVEYAARQARIKESIAAQNQPLSAENIMTQSQSTGDKMSLAMNTPFGNPKDYPVLSGYMEGLDYINPFKFVGDMASGLGAVPYNVQQGNYGQAALAIGTPLAAGALAGIGTQGTKQFVNNLANPFAGINFRKGAKQIPGSDNVASSVEDVGRSLTQAPKPAWQMEELPGLHLQSTMENGAVSKIVEPKTGLINTEQALAIIGKESGGADKVSLIKKGLGESVPKKMDYNDFRKTVQDQLIPLERQFSTQASNYGVGRLGYPSPKRSSYEAAIKHNEEMIAHYKKQIAAGSNNSSLKGDLQNAINNLENSKKELATLPLENQTLILSNKGKFGRGSGAHGNPEETLGHAHFLRDAETPDVLTVTQIQSDAFQGTHRIMPKTQQEALEKVNKLKEEGVEIKSMFGDGKESSNAVLANYEKHLQLDEASAKNFTQKQLLDKNHQERYLQELVDYAGKRGDVNKIRVPTSETAAKVQGYSKNTATGMDEMGLPTDLGYSKEHQTILKKYSEQPKTIKKLFGEEPKIVTDSKGNTWYEFDIPKKFKEGKGEIKALSAVGVVGTGAATQTKNEPYGNGGKIKLKPKFSDWEIVG